MNKKSCINNMLPLQILSGAGCSADLYKYLPEGKILIITDKGLMHTGLVSKLISGNHFEKYEIYDGIIGEPRISDAQKALNYAESIHADVIIGIGGGSVLDTAKAAAVCMYNETSVIGALANGSLRRKPYLAAIPTTAGTGSEATRNAILIDDNDGVKKAVIADACIPDIAVLDGALTAGLPDIVTAYTGIDALCHCAESYISIHANEISRVYSTAGLRLITENIEGVLADSADLILRQNMLTASFFGGAALAIAGTCGVHAFAYPLGKRGIPHGAANSMLFKAVMFHTLDEPIKIIPGFNALCAIIDRMPLPCIKSYGIASGEADIECLAKEALDQKRLLGNHPSEIDFTKAKKIYQSLFE